MRKVLNLSCMIDEDVSKTFYSGCSVSLPEELKESIISEVNKSGTILDGEIKSRLLDFCISENVSVIAISSNLPMRTLLIDKTDSYYVIVINDKHCERFLEGSSLYSENQAWFDMYESILEPKIFKQNTMRILSEKLVGLL